MLDPWIIEEIRRREEADRRQKEQRPMLEIHIETPRERAEPQRDRDVEDQHRGVTIINFL